MKELCLIIYTAVGKQIMLSSSDFVNKSHTPPKKTRRPVCLLLQLNSVSNKNERNFRCRVGITKVLISCETTNAGAGILIAHNLATHI